MKYEDRVICFIDILGFKERIERSVTDEKSIEEITRVISALEQDFKVTFNEYRQVIQFSDSLAISFLVSEKDQVFNLITELQGFLICLADWGIFFRGGITVGKLLHTDKLFFGSAFIKAYELENLAIYPRVIFDEKLIDQLIEHRPIGSNEESVKQFIGSYVKKDCDGLYYLDYIDCEDWFKGASDWGAGTYIDYLEKFSNTVRDQLTTTTDMKVRQKYQWLANKYNQIIKSKKDGPQKGTYSQISLID